MAEEEKVALSVRMPPGMIKWIDKRCREQNIDRSAVVRECVIACQLSFERQGEMEGILAALK
jgi:hypothetical protein